MGCIPSKNVISNQQIDINHENVNLLPSPSKFNKDKSFKIENVKEVYMEPTVTKPENISIKNLSTPLNNHNTQNMNLFSNFGQEKYNTTKIFSNLQNTVNFSNMGDGTNNAGTQTSFSSPQLFAKKMNEHWQLGPMAIKQHPMNILLVFAQEDNQSDGFWWAAQKMGYKCDLASNAETAVELYLNKIHDLVIIDRRDKNNVASPSPVNINVQDSKTLKNEKVASVKLLPLVNSNTQTCSANNVKYNKYDRRPSCFDPDTLCRSLRATKCNEFTIIHAVVNVGDDNRGGDTILSTELLKAGFNKYFVENSNVNACLNEIVMIENDSFLNRCKLFNTKGLFAALDHIQNAIDISTVNDKEIVYVNKAFEKLSEYSADELINCSTKIYLPPGKVDQIEMSNKFIAKGKIWEGNSVIETKSGRKLWHYCISIPIQGTKNDIIHVVNVRFQPTDDEGLSEHAYSESYFLPRRGSMSSLPRNIDILSSIRNEENVINLRRPSLARIRSMTIEAPITRVINILTTAQRSSPFTVSQALDRVIEILHSSELYNLGRGQLLGGISRTQHSSGNRHVDKNSGFHTPTGSLDHPNNRSAKLLNNLNNLNLNNMKSNSNINKIDGSVGNKSLGTSPNTLGVPRGIDDRHAARASNEDETSAGKVNEHFCDEEDEKITADLVGNLAGINLEPRLSKSGMFRKHSTIPLNYQLIEAHPLLEISDDVRKIINEDNEWDFPIFQLERFTHKKPLYYLAARIFQRFGVAEYLKVSNDTIHAWLQMIEGHYKPSIPYHNSTHASDVLQASAYFLQNPLIREVLEEHEVMGALIAATIHDLDHPGRNSAFLCNAHADLAILYNDKSVLESHHVALGFKLTLSNDQCNIFKNLPRGDFKSLRKIIVEMVLATEMAKHFEILSKFLTFLDKCNSMVKAKKKRGIAQHSTQSLGFMSTFGSGKETANVRRTSLGATTITNSKDLSTNKPTAFIETETCSIALPKKTYHQPNIESALLQIMHEEIDERSSQQGDSPLSSSRGITINFTETADTTEPERVLGTVGTRSASLADIKALRDDQECEIRTIREDERAMGQFEDTTTPDDVDNDYGNINTNEQLTPDDSLSFKGTLVEAPTSQYRQAKETTFEKVGDRNFDKRKSSVTSMALKRNLWREVLIELLVGSEGEDPDLLENKDGESSLSGADSSGKPSFVSLEDAERHRLLILSMLIKCSDVSNPCRSLDICKEWSKRIAEEYFDQTEEEKRLGLPVVMPTFDRTACNIPQSQLSFIDYFVNGMYESWDSFCNVPELMENLKINYKYWKIMADDVKHKRLSSVQLFTADSSNSNISP